MAEGVLFRAFDDQHLTWKEKKARFLAALQEVVPDRIIATGPFTLNIACRYRRSSTGKVKVIYDVTEWFPSKKELLRPSLFLRIVLFPGYLFYNFFAAARTDAFIFGEWYKSRPYRHLFPRKKHLFLGYYPDLRYIPYVRPVALKDKLRLSYSGKLSREKGFGNFLDAVRTLSLRRPQLEIEVKVIGWYAGRGEEKILTSLIAALPEKVKVISFPFLEFHRFPEEIKDTDVFLDLRSDDAENRRCLPIKIFYYAAFGRPVIYSDLKAIRREVETDRFGFLVKPGDTVQVTELLEKYLEDPVLYLAHCRNARRLAEERYNWDAVKDDFISFLEKTDAP